VSRQSPLTFILKIWYVQGMLYVWFLNTTARVYFQTVPNQRFPGGKEVALYGNEENAD
jgi:hypothetical protein